MNDLKEKFIYFLAKYFGIVESRGKFCIAKDVYIYDEEFEPDYDRILYYYAVSGIQIFPSIKKVKDFPLGYCSIYRDYIFKRIKAV